MLSIFLDEILTGLGLFIKEIEFKQSVAYIYIYIYITRITCSLLALKTKKNSIHFTHYLIMYQLKGSLRINI